MRTKLVREMRVFADSTKNLCAQQNEVGRYVQFVGTHGLLEFSNDLPSRHEGVEEVP